MKNSQVNPVDKIIASPIHKDSKSIEHNEQNTNSKSITKKVTFESQQNIQSIKTHMFSNEKISQENQTAQENDKIPSSKFTSLKNVDQDPKSLLKKIENSQEDQRTKIQKQLSIEEIINSNQKQEKTDFEIKPLVPILQQLDPEEKVAVETPAILENGKTSNQSINPTDHKQEDIDSIEIKKENKLEIPLPTISVMNFDIPPKDTIPNYIESLSDIDEGRSENLSISQAINDNDSNYLNPEAATLRQLRKSNSSMSDGQPKRIKLVIRSQEDSMLYDETSILFSDEKRQNKNNDKNEEMSIDMFSYIKQNVQNIYNPLEHINDENEVQTKSPMMVKSLNYLVERQISPKKRAISKFTEKLPMSDDEEESRISVGSNYSESYKKIETFDSKLYRRDKTIVTEDNVDFGVNVGIIHFDICHKINLEHEQKLKGLKFTEDQESQKIISLEVQLENPVKSYFFGPRIGSEDTKYRKVDIQLSKERCLGQILGGGFETHLSFIKFVDSYGDWVETVGFDFYHDDLKYYQGYINYGDDVVQIFVQMSDDNQHLLGVTFVPQSDIVPFSKTKSMQ